MDKTRSTIKLTSDPDIAETQRRIQPLSTDEIRTRRESLIEAAMDVALRDVSRNQQEPVARLDPSTDRRRGMKAESRPGSWPGNLTETPIHLKPVEKDTRRATGVPVEARRGNSFFGVAEHCERLKAHLCTRYPGETMKVILFVGITSGSGVSTAAANFADSLAQDGDSKVLLMDANFRSARQQNADVLQEEAGGHIDLAQLVSNPAPISPMPGPSNLYVLPRGIPESTPLALFQSEGFDGLLQRVRQNFRYVVIDGPALQGAPESLVLSRKVDGVILVVESERTRKRTAQWAKEQIDGTGGKLLGVVLNKRKYYIPDWLYRHI